MNMQKWLRVGIAGLVALLAVQSNGAPPVGAYYGVVRRDTTVFSPITVVCGTFSMNTTARGRITAKIALRERTLSFKAEGWQETEGGPHVRMEGRGGEVLELLSLANLGTVGTLSGGSLGDEKMFIAATYHAFADQAVKIPVEIGAPPFSAAGVHVEGEELIPDRFGQILAGQPVDRNAVFQRRPALLLQRLALAGSQRFEKGIV